MLIALSTVKWAYEWASVCANKRFFPITIGINFLVQLPMLQQSMWWGDFEMEIPCFFREIENAICMQNYQIEAFKFQFTCHSRVSNCCYSKSRSQRNRWDINLWNWLLQQKKSISISLREFFIFDFAHERDKLSPYDLMSSSNQFIVV